jgi:hypothetical protein
MKSGLICLEIKTHYHHQTVKELCHVLPHFVFLTSSQWSFCFLVTLLPVPHRKFGKSVRTSCFLSTSQIHFFLYSDVLVNVVVHFAAFSRVFYCTHVSTCSFYFTHVSTCFFLFYTRFHAHSLFYTRFHVHFLILHVFSRVFYFTHVRFHVHFYFTHVRFHVYFLFYKCFHVSALQLRVCSCLWS